MVKAKKCLHCGDVLNEGGAGYVASKCVSNECSGKNSAVDLDRRRCPQCGSKYFHVDFQSRVGVVSCVCLCMCKFTAPSLEPTHYFRGWGVVTFSDDPTHSCLTGNALVPKHYNPNKVMPLSEVD